MNGPNVVNFFFDQVLIRAGSTDEPSKLKFLIKLFADGAAGETGDPEAQLHSQFAQFIVGELAASRALSRHELNELGDWLAWSLSPSVESGRVQELEVSRLARFIDPTIWSWPQFRDIYARWFSHFYYYARRRAAMPDIAEEILPIVMRFVRLVWRNTISETDARMACNILSWCVQELPEALPQILSLVESAASDSRVHGRARLLLAMTLAGKPGEFSGEPREHWRSLAFNDLSIWHQDHDRLHLLVDALGTRDDESLFEGVIKEIDRHQSWAVGQDISIVDLYRAVDALSPLLQVALHSCLSRGQGDRVVTLLAHWYCISTTEILDPAELLIQCPFIDIGYLSLIGSDLFQVRRDTQELLVSLTAASNQFLGKYESVTGDAFKVPHIPDRLGVVDDSHAQIFEELLTEAYVPVPGAFEGRHFLGQIVVPSKAHPVQAIQLRSGTPSAPIIASLRKPLPDRVVRRVALWSGAGSMTEEIERQVVMAAFAQQGIEVHQVEPGDASVERFLAMYASNEFDIIWLMSHGNFDHYAPKNASLVIAENGREVGITDLLRTTPVALQRRLLMLNVCDGGRFEEIGVLPRVGVAPSAALASQATVSHLWPVHGMAAAAFGAILASNLAYGSSYFQAFRQTLLSLNVETPQVAELLRTRLGPSATALVDRIERTNIDFTNLAHSGSAVFYG